MAYPGDANLDAAVQQRILTAFKEAVRLYRDGHGEEARTILRSITDVDARFAPAQRLEQAIAAGAPVDLAQLIGEVTAKGGVDAAAQVAAAEKAFADRDFEGALAQAQAVLRDMPGHARARQLAFDAQNRLRTAAEVQAHLERCRQSLDAGRAEDARGALALAKTLDPGHPDLAGLEQRLQAMAKPQAVEAEPEFEFEVFERPPEAPPTSVPPVSPDLFIAPEVPAPAQLRPAAEPAAPAAAPAPVAKPPVPAPPEPAEAPGFAFDDDGAGGGVEFHAGASGAFSAGAPPPAPAENAAARIQTLLDQGQHEFDSGDFQAAVDTWSRIYLVDASNAEADSRIEQARRRREEVERLAEQNFYEAHEAFEQKRFDDARLLCQQVLKLVPQHLEAHDLLQRLETPAAPPPPPVPAPGLAQEEDLFRDEFVPAPVSSSGSAPAIHGPLAPPAEPAAVARQVASAAAAVGRRLPSLPLSWIGVAVTVLALAGGAAFLLRGKVFSNSKTAVNEALAESERLAGQGRLQNALQVLQSLQGQVEGEQANRVNQRILELQRRLKAKAVAPPPAADSQAVAAALAAGLRVKAMKLVRQGLASAPGDAELTRFEAEIAAYDPVMPALADAVASKNWESIRSLADQVLRSHPGDHEALQLWSAATFNLAVLNLRRYQVADGHGLLVELCKRNTDPDAERLRELAKSYLSRPTDPRYTIFVSNVELRPVE